MRRSRFNDWDQRERWRRLARRSLLLRVRRPASAHPLLDLRPRDTPEAVLQQPLSALSQRTTRLLALLALLPGDALRPAERPTLAARVRPGIESVALEIASALEIADLRCDVSPTLLRELVHKRQLYAAIAALGHDLVRSGLDHQALANALLRQMLKWARQELRRRFAAPDPQAAVLLTRFGAVLVDLEHDLQRPVRTRRERTRLRKATRAQLETARRDALVEEVAAQVRRGETPDRAKLIEAARHYYSQHPEEDPNRDGPQAPESAPPPAARSAARRRTPRKPR